MTSIDTNSLGLTFFPTLRAYLASCLTEFALIPDDRKLELEKVSAYVRQSLSKGQVAKLTFICTHNSRRSHLSQIWAQVAAEYLGIEGIETYSGGTEATAFNPRAVTALERCGLKIDAQDLSDSNPKYKVTLGESSLALPCYSKIYDQPPNPTKGYAAIMTCSNADEACPLVMGCELRQPVRYDDPKIGDDTPQESQLYDERSRQICREMLYLMMKVN